MASAGTNIRLSGSMTADGQPIVYTQQTLAHLNLRDSMKPAVGKLDDARGFKANEVINFVLPDPLSVALTGAGYLGGQPKPGVEKGPRAIRDAGLMTHIGQLNWNVHDLGDIDFSDCVFPNDPPSSNGCKRPRAVGHACQKIYEHTKVQAQQGRFTLTIGGDHSLAMGSIAANLRSWEDLAVVWVDAHGDINTPKTSPSGNMHGMPVSFLMHMVDSDTSEMPGWEWFKDSHPPLKKSKIVYIGLRDVDPGEKKILRELGIKVFSMTEIDDMGMGKVMSETLAHLCTDDTGRKTAIHLSYDVDAIDPKEVPSTGTAVKGGLTYREGRYICEALARSGRLVGMDIVEVNPTIGSDKDAEASASVAVDLAKSALGEKLW